MHRAHIRVVDRDSGTELVRYGLAAGGLSSETALVFGELYRHGAEWKFRAVGQGYTSGLAGIATDYGVDVLRETAPADPVPVTPPPVPPTSTAPPPTVVSSRAPALAGSPQSSGSSSVTCFFDPNHGPA